jgi:hypothetical protein
MNRSVAAGWRVHLSRHPPQIASGGSPLFMGRPTERVEKVTKAFRQRLFQHWLVEGPEISAKVGLLLALQFICHGAFPPTLIRDEQYGENCYA